MFLTITINIKKILDLLIEKKKILNEKIEFALCLNIIPTSLTSSGNSTPLPPAPPNTPVEGVDALNANDLISRLDRLTTQNSDNTSSEVSNNTSSASQSTFDNSSSESLVNTSSEGSTEAVNSLDSLVAGQNGLLNNSIQDSFNDFNIPGPLDQFNVTELVGLKFEILGKFYLAITNISLYLGLVLAVIIAIFYFGDNDSKLVPNKWSIVLETFFASIKGMVKDQIGLAYEIFLPLIFSIFFFFLTGNLISNIPYSFAANASGVVSIGYSLTFFMGVTIMSLFRHGDKFFRNFIPEGTPLALVPLLVSIEFTSYTARGFSLGVRMFSNLFSGHCLLAILSVFGNQLLGVN